VARAKLALAATTAGLHPCDETSGCGKGITAVTNQFKIDLRRFERNDTHHSDAAAAKAP